MYLEPNQTCCCTWIQTNTIRSHVVILFSLPTSSCSYSAIELVGAARPAFTSPGIYRSFIVLLHSSHRLLLFCHASSASSFLIRPTKASQVEADCSSCTSATHTQILLTHGKFTGIWSLAGLFSTGLSGSVFAFADNTNKVALIL